MYKAGYKAGSKAGRPASSMWKPRQIMCWSTRADWEKPKANAVSGSGAVSGAVT